MPGKDKVRYSKKFKPKAKLTVKEKKEVKIIAQKQINKNQEVKQRAWQINSSYSLYHNQNAILFGSTGNGGLLELKQQGATSSTHLTSRPAPVTSTPHNNAGFLREGNKVKVSSVHLNLCCTTPIDRQGTKLRVFMFWYPVGHNVVWSDLVADGGMTGAYNTLLVPTNRNSVCKIFMDKVFTLGVPGAGTAGGGGNYQTTTMLKLRKSFKNGKVITYSSDASSALPDRMNIGFACVAFNNNDATITDNVASFEYSGNLYFRDA